MSIQITPKAIEHFENLVIKEKEKNSLDQQLNLRLVVVNPQTPDADVNISYCHSGEEHHSDLQMGYNKFSIFIEQASMPALEECVIDYFPDEFGGQLNVQAPYINGDKIAKGASLIEKMQFTLEKEINPNLASHGGFVQLIDVTDDNVVKLQFGGGCHGCGMAKMTLKNGIEKTLLTKYPEIKEIQDVTDHSAGDNPYY